MKLSDSKQDALNYLTWTYFFRRLLMNPNYYNLESIEGNAINDYLSELVQKTVKDRAPKIPAKTIFKKIKFNENFLEFLLFYTKKIFFDHFDKFWSPDQGIIFIWCRGN